MAESQPKPAAVEEWDSDQSSARPHTMVRAQSAKNKEQHQQQQQQHASSRHSKPGSRSEHARTSKTSSKAKPVIHRIDSARSSSKAPPVSNTAVKRSEKCSDPYCNDPHCVSAPNPERRYTLSNQQFAPPQPAKPDYAQMMPPPRRPRADTDLGARPQSFNGYVAGAPVPYSPAPPVLPASNYYAYPQQWPQQQSQQPAPHESMPPSTSTTTYPGFPGSGYPANISARNGLEHVRSMSTRRPSVSARRSITQLPPGPLTAEPETLDPASVTDDTSSESESEDERYRQRYRSEKQLTAARSKSRGPVAATKALVHHPRRPSVSRKSLTETAVPTRLYHRRDSTSRPTVYHSRSDTRAEWNPSADSLDSDRTARAVVPRASGTISKYNTRRESLSTTASSRSTKATTVSGDTSYSRAIIEDKHGRRVTYLSKEQQADLIKQYERQKLEDRLDSQRMTERRITAYQEEQAAGFERQKLTAENVKRQNRKSMSHLLGRSLVSADSASKASRSGGVKIESGGTVLYVDGGHEIQVKTDEEGGTHLVIGSSNGRENAYYASKTGGSRMGRSRMSRQLHDDEETLDGYERPL